MSMSDGSSCVCSSYLLRVIAEAFIYFDYEITLLTVRHKDGVAFCPPIGHRQERGDYRESWQPAAMSDTALAAAQAMAAKVVDALGGHGIFGVEFFVKGDAVIFSELSPRPHDTGMVTLISQSLTQFDLRSEEHTSELQSLMRISYAVFCLKK